MIDRMGLAMGRNCSWEAMIVDGRKRLNYASGKLYYAYGTKVF